MTWTNAFDLGACTVEVFHASNPTVATFSGVLAKDATELFTDGAYELSIAVDADGVVTLANVGGETIEDNMGVRVLPGYSLDLMDGARVVAPSSAVTFGDGSASANGTTYIGFAFSDPLVDLSSQAIEQIAVRISLGGQTAETPILAFTPEFDAAPAPPPDPIVPPCVELGRVVRVYASAYDRTKVHDGRLVRGEARSLVVEFNGAIAPCRRIESVTWRCIDPAVIVMSNARIQTGARSVAVDARANLPCDTAIKCEATLDNGERYMQLIRLDVMDSPWFGDETTASGPTTLTSP